MASASTVTTTTPRPRAALAALTLALAIAFVAVNLRPAIAALAPVLSAIERSTGLSAAGAGLLTTVPVLAFGACAPLAPALGRRFGIEAALVGAIALLCAGIVLRSVPGTGLLFSGTVLLGVGIAIGNVLVPALIKRDFPTRPREATAVYSVALSAGAAVAAGVTVPLSHALGGWRWGLGVWAAPVALCLGLWAFRLRDVHHDIGPAHVSARLWRDPLAWQVTGFMGLQSLGYYAMITWLPTILERHGIDPTAAGWYLSLSGFVSLPAALVAPIVGSSPRRQRACIAFIALANVTAASGLILWPSQGVVAWMFLLGAAQGGAISLALTFIVVRAPDARRAAELSGMAQTVGYLVAGVGPALIGALRDVTGGWTVPLAVLAAVLVPELVCGLGSARDQLVGKPRAPVA